eukprot:TRINITY_DN9739_c0_g3_i1.p1 TRINITY_DN9739_c0_g3~~TRINITY_DN9739_c0_g3_i1.p1  ORF type:complete len:858 (+),score=156.09 TRINITY_DN9739_c0_g3_i1:127-2700(+)
MLRCLLLLGAVLLGTQSLTTSRRRLWAANKHFYEVLPSSMSWQTAYEHAKNQSFLVPDQLDDTENVTFYAHLVTISSSEERAFVLNLLDTIVTQTGGERLQDNQFWLAGRYTNSKWQWADGPERGSQLALADHGFGGYRSSTPGATTYAQWDDGEPNTRGVGNGVTEGCVEMYGGSGRWNDDHCEVDAMVVLEYENWDRSVSQGCGRGSIFDLALGCIQIDYCAEAPPCIDPRRSCVNGVDASECKCSQGYFELGGSCEDLDECAFERDNCPNNTKCSNTIGSYDCECQLGYVFNRTLEACVEGDLCETNPCDSTQTCVDLDKGYACRCSDGFLENRNITTRLVCDDIDECAQANTSLCGDFSTCTNVPGSFFCRCDAGYFRPSDLVKTAACLDRDECAENRCGPNTECTNTAGSYECRCAAGFTLNDGQCDDVNECLATTSPCNPGDTCLNTEGSFMCQCPADGDGTPGRQVDAGPCSALASTAGDEGGDSMWILIAFAIAVVVLVALFMLLKPYIWKTRAELRHVSMASHLNPQFRSDIAGPGANLHTNLAYEGEEEGPIIIDQGGYDRTPAPGALLSTGHYSQPQDGEEAYEAVDDPPSQQQQRRLPGRSNTTSSTGYMDIGQSDGEASGSIVASNGHAYGTQTAMADGDAGVYGIAESAGNGIAPQEVYKVAGSTPAHTLNTSTALYESSSNPALPDKVGRAYSTHGGKYGVTQAASSPQYHPVEVDGQGPPPPAQALEDMTQCLFYHGSVNRIQAEATLHAAPGEHVFLLRTSTSESNAHVISVRDGSKCHHHLVHRTREGYWRIDADVRKFSSVAQPPTTTLELVQLMQQERVVPLPEVLGEPVLASASAV